MNNLSQYIIEKLRINKDTKTDILKNNYIINDENIFKYIIDKNCINKNGYSLSDTERVANKLKYPKNLINVWIAILLMTKSTPIIKDDKIYSYPGNYGQPLLEKALKNNSEISFFEIIDAYEKSKDEYQDKYFKEDYNLYIKQCVETLLDTTMKGLSSCYELKSFEEDSYSKFINDNLDKFKDKILIPFRVKYNKQTVDCEIIVSYSGNRYYGFYINSKDCKYANGFVEKLAEELNI